MNSHMMSMGYLTEIGMLSDDPRPLQIAPAAAIAGGSQASASKPPAKPQQQKKASAKAEAAAPSSAAAAAAPAFVERSAEELQKMSKEDRKAYHQARIAAQQPAAAGAAVASAAAAGDAAAGKQLTKQQRREMQEAQRKAKDDLKVKPGEFDDLVKELKMQGLTEVQAREVAKQMATAEQPDAEEEDDDDEADEDLTASVRRWMGEQAEKIDEDALHDFVLKVRFQGHADSLPPDHIHSSLLVLVDQGLSGLDLLKPKLQPGAVAKQVAPLAKRWAPFLKPLYGKAGDVLRTDLDREAADVCVAAVFEVLEAREGVSEAARASAAVGVLMALQDIELMEDQDLALACKRIDKRSTVLDKYIEHLEEDSDEEDSD